MTTQIQLRRGTAAQWTAANPTLAAGELAAETDTGKFKIGNGSTAWTSLAYSSGTPGAAGGVSSVGGTGTVSGLTLTGTVTSTGNLTLGGTLALGALATTGTAGGLSGTPAVAVAAITCTTITASGAITSTGNVTAYYSDDRLKTRLGAIENALDKVDSLDTFYYEANALAQSLGYEPVREVGLSAQQVQSVMPEVIAPAPIDPEYLTIRYERLLALAFAAIKELRAEIRSLK